MHYLRYILVSASLLMVGNLGAATYTYAQNQSPLPSVQCSDLVGCSECETGSCLSCDHTHVLGRHRIRLGSVAGCQICDEGCILEIKEEKEKKTCFKTEEKTICIPPVQLPFKRFCPPLIAKSKTIKVLKKETYESPITKYTWKKPEPPKPESPKSESSKPSKEAGAPAKAAMQFPASNAW